MTNDQAQKLGIAFATLLDAVRELDEPAPAPADDWNQRRTDFVKQVQELLGVRADGLPGPDTLRAFEALKRAFKA